MQSWRHSKWLYLPPHRSCRWPWDSAIKGRPREIKFSVGPAVDAGPIVRVTRYHNDGSLSAPGMVEIRREGQGFLVAVGGLWGLFMFFWLGRNELQHERMMRASLARSRTLRPNDPF